MFLTLDEEKEYRIKPTYNIKPTMRLHYQQTLMKTNLIKFLNKIYSNNIISLQRYLDNQTDMLIHKTDWHKYYENSKDKKQKYSRDYYHKNKEHCKRYSKQRYNKNKDEILRYNKEHYIEYQTKAILRHGNPYSHIAKSVLILNTFLAT